MNRNQQARSGKTEPKKKIIEDNPNKNNNNRNAKQITDATKGRDK